MTNMIRTTYTFEGKTVHEFCSALIELIEARREMVPRDQGTRVVTAKCDGKIDAYNDILNILHGLEFPLSAGSEEE